MTFLVQQRGYRYLRNLPRIMIDFLKNISIYLIFKSSQAKSNINRIGYKSHFRYSICIQRLTAFFFSGGTLKTPAQADCHSLQAKWVADVEDLSLRAKDVRYVLEVGRMYRAALKQGQAYFSPTLVAINPHKRLLLRLVICVRQRSK